MNRQYDKKSKLEFVAIQFGVKFTIMYKLCHFVDGFCQLYLHYLPLFRKLWYFYELFHDFTSTHFYLFSRSFYIMDLGPWEAILNWEGICCSPIGCSYHGGRRGLLPHLHLLKTLKRMVSVNEHLKEHSSIGSVDNVSEDQQGEWRLYQSELSG